MRELRISIDGFNELATEVGDDEAIRIAREALARAADKIERFVRSGRRVQFLEEDGRELIRILPAQD